MTNSGDDSEETTMEPGERVDRLVCPKCGHDGSEGGAIVYVETVESCRKVLGVRFGAVCIDGNYENVEGSERDPYFQCRAESAAGVPCGHRWPLSESVRENLAEALLGRLDPVLRDEDASDEGDITPSA